jgi:hypothetical protein
VACSVFHRHDQVTVEVHANHDGKLDGDEVAWRETHLRGNCEGVWRDAPPNICNPIARRAAATAHAAKCAPNLRSGRVLRYTCREVGPLFGNRQQAHRRAAAYDCTLLYLVSLGMVAAATVGAFFGIGFLLLAHPKEEPIAGAGTRDFGAEVSPWRSSLLPRPDNAASPPPETELPDPTAAAAHPVPPPQGLSAREVLPSGYHETGQSSEQRSTAANAPASTTNDASSGQTVPVLGSTTAQAALIAPVRVTHAAGVGRHRREGARKPAA